MCIDWSNFISTLAGAFAGAWGAYCFNLIQAEKQQKDMERAQLTQLFYDLNILSKFICRYGSNAIKLIENICNGSVPYNTPLSMDPETIEIEKLGFITLKSNKMYEILAHTRMEIVTIFEQGVVYNEAVIQEKEDTMMQLISICMLFPKLIAMIYVSLFNINSMLMKYYKSDNLIKDNILNCMAEMMQIIDNVKNQYNEVKNNKEITCMYTGKPYTKEQIDVHDEIIEYIDYILKEWKLNFGLSKKDKKKIEEDLVRKLAEIEELENDL